MQLSTTANLKNQLVGYGYDAAGNLTQEGSGSLSWNYTYDAENRVSSISGSASESFKYDGDGERVYKSYGGLAQAFTANHHGTGCPSFRAFRKLGTTDADAMFTRHSRSCPAMLHRAHA